jgi:ankyrin repeat protein
MMEDFSTDYDVFRSQIERPHDQTCHWSRLEPGVDSWVSESSGLIWLVGGPGTGKSVLARHLVESLTQRDVHGSKTIYFFCDREKKHEHGAAFILRCLIHQCMVFAKSLGKKHVQPRYIEYGPVLLGQKFRLEQIFVKMMSDPGPGEWYCIIDALDNCEEAEAKALLEYFAAETQGHGGQQACSLRFLITSRPSEVIRSTISKLRNATTVHFTNVDGKQLNEADISKYILDHVRNLGQYPEEEQPAMGDDLIEKADGNFTWAVSMIRSLGTAPPDGYSDLLAKLPTGMETMVERIIERARDESLNLLRLLAVVERPLSVTELFTMCTVRGGPFGNLLPSERAKDAIRNRIQHGEEALKLRNDEIVFFHPSVAEKIRKVWTEEEVRETHTKLVEVCLMYLILVGRDHRPIKGKKKSVCQTEYKELVHQLPLLEYAAVYWPCHLRSAGPISTQRVWAVIHQCLDNDVSRELSFQIYRFWHHDKYIEGQSILHILVFHNLTSIAQQLSEKLKLFVNHVDSTGKTPLWWAVEKRSVEMVSLLLDMEDIDCNIRDSDEDISPAILAVRHGYTDIVRLFLESKGALIVWSPLRGSHVNGLFNCLYWATIHEYEDLVTLLLQRGNFHQLIEERCDGQTPLVSAARNGYERVVAALLTFKADPNSADEAEGLTVLSWAARNGHKKVVDRLLQDSHINIDARDRLERNCFHWATAHNHDEIASAILREMCCRWNSQAQEGCTALLLEAAMKGQSKAIETLLGREGLRPDSTCAPGYRTALSFAAEYGQFRVVQQLIGDSRTNVNATDVHLKTPLMWAADKGHADVVKLLLERDGIDVVLKDSKQRTACDWAQIGGRPEIFKLIKGSQRLMEL